MRRKLLWVLLLPAVLAVGTLLAWAQPLPRPEPARGIKDQIEKMGKKLDEVTPHADNPPMSGEPIGTSVTEALSGDWSIVEARQGGKAATAPVTGLAFTGQRVRFRYRDARGEREYSFRADEGLPVPMLDLYEPGGTVTLAALALDKFEPQTIAVERLIRQTVMKRKLVAGEAVEYPETVMVKVKEEVTVDAAHELRIAFDAGTGLRPVDLTGKEPTSPTVWVLKREGAYRAPPAAYGGPPAPPAPVAPGAPAQ